MSRVFPDQLSPSDVVNALDKINSKDENIKIESINILGNTVGLLSDTTLESGAIFLLGAISNQNEETIQVKQAATIALKKIEERCKNIGDKMDLSILALTFLPKAVEKKKTKPYVVVLITVAILLVIFIIICLISSMVLFLGN